MPEAPSLLNGGLTNKPKPPREAPRETVAAPAVPASVMAFVANRLGTLGMTARKLRLESYERYLEGEQYRDRPYDENGCHHGTRGIYGGPDGSPSWKDRTVRAVNNIAGDITNQLKQWSVTGSSWASLGVHADDTASEWLEGVAASAELASGTAECVRVAGGTGTAVVSATWRRDETNPSRGGAARFEVHMPSHCWPLSWADRRGLVPHEVVKVFRQYDEYAMPTKGKEPDNGEGAYVLRYWSGAARLPDGRLDPAGTPGVEAYFLAQKDEQGRWAVSVLVPPVAHGSERCPVFWVTRGDVREEDGFDGKPFFAGAEGLIDAANELEQAGDNTSKRNADDTLVVHEDASKAPQVLRKGALGAIFAKGGAEYLSQKGDSAKHLYELGKERENQAYRQSHVVKVDIDTLSRQTSGESLKRLYFPMISEADEIRVWVTRYFVRPACEWLLVTSRAWVAKGLAVEVPPVEEAAKDGSKTKVYRTRLPGVGQSVRVTWPQAFPPTLDDLKTASEASKNATGGDAVMSRETGVRVMQRAGAPVDSPEAELERLREDAEAKAENQAKGIGLATAAELAASPEAGRAGDVTAGGEDDDGPPSRDVN